MADIPETMAVDVCTEICSLGTSPRISFSQDLKHKDTQRSDSSLLDPDFNFNFCIGKSSFNQELQSADELFSNGKILPIEIKKSTATIKQSHQCNSTVLHTRPCSIARSTSENVIDDTKKKLIEFLSIKFDEEEAKPMSKSFWQFRRSTSLNCDNGQGKSLIRSLQVLSRSNSTGSTPNPKPSAGTRDAQKQHSFKEPPPASYSQPSPLSYYGYYPYNSSKRPPLKKKSRSYGNGVRISPVLNIPHNCMAKGGVNLFGLGSLICMGKAKKRK